MRTSSTAHTQNTQNMKYFPIGLLSYIVVQTCLMDAMVTFKPVITSLSAPKLAVKINAKTFTRKLYKILSNAWTIIVNITKTILREQVSTALWKVNMLDPGLIYAQPNCLPVIKMYSGISHHIEAQTFAMHYTEEPNCTFRAIVIYAVVWYILFVFAYDNLCRYTHMPGDSFLTATSNGRPDIPCIKKQLHLTRTGGVRSSTFSFVCMLQAHNRQAP